MEISKELEKIKEVREGCRLLAIEYNEAKQIVSSREKAFIEKFRSRISEKFCAKTGKHFWPTIELHKFTDRGVVFTTSYEVGRYGEYNRIYVKIELTHDVIKMSDEDFNTYIESYRETMQELKEKKKLRITEAMRKAGEVRRKTQYEELKKEFE